MSDTKKVERARTLLLWASVGVGVLALFVVLLGGVAFAYERMNGDKIFPGVRVFNVRLDGLTKQEARSTLEKTVDDVLAKGVPFSYGGRDVVVNTQENISDPDTSHDNIHYDLDKAIDAAYALGRDGGWQTRFAIQSRMRVAPIDIHPDTHIDRQGFADELQAAYKNELHGPVDAAFVFHASSTPVDVTITPEQEGSVLLTDEAFDELQQQAADLDFHTINLKGKKMEPAITRDDLAQLLPQAKSMVNHASLAFTYEDKEFPVPTSMLAGWISVTGTRGGFTVAIDPEAFATGLKSLAGSVEQEGKNGSLVTKDGKIVSFVSGTSGVALDTDATLKEVQSGWSTSSTFPIITKVKPAKLTGEDPEKMGITELLGVGHSNFSGSPSNRRKNIAHGAALVNGTIIQPGETFSLIKTLGAIDGEHNWLPELVIKGNETKPEFGGGLCQIGTTTFRAALASGLPIVERANHSYRVRYYEPAGTDATIYDPKPDFRFLNDTEHPILINAYLKGDDAYFEFWGTRDGRRMEQTKPVVSNIVQPPPMKLVETLDLAPGVKKCTETAHAGADASFDYTVTYASGEVKKETFRSHYKPWQAVCLIGVKTLTASSTPVTLGQP